MRYLKYFSAQLKRTLKLAVGVFPTAMLLFACLGLVAYFFLSSGFVAEKQEKYQIGIIGQIDETYLGFGIFAIQSLDSTRFMVDFIPMQEEEAKRAFEQGDLVAYVNVPEEFLESVIYGRNDVPIRYVASDKGSGIEGYLMEELAVVVSDLVASSQCSIYSMQAVARELGMTEQLRDRTEEFNLQLISYVLGRTGLVELEQLGLSKGLLIRQYYFCTIILLFIFLFGISSAPLFLRRNEDLGKWMKMRGIGAIAQVLCEFITYFAFAYACVIIPLGILNAATKQMSFLNQKIWFDELALALLPVTLTVCAMHYLIYETVKNPVANLLLQFIGVLGMSYVSGYIYPASFFPEGLEAVGRILPTGTAFSYLSGSLFKADGAGSVWSLMTYAAIFLVISVLARRWAVIKENR